MREPSGWTSGLRIEVPGRSCRRHAFFAGNNIYLICVARISGYVRKVQRIQVTSVKVPICAVGIASTDGRMEVDESPTLRVLIETSQT